VCIVVVVLCVSLLVILCVLFYLSFVYFCSCLVCINVSCLVCIGVVVLCVLLLVVLCVLLSSYMHLLYYVCIAVFLLWMPDCWLEVSIRNVLRPATSTQVFLGFPVSISKC